MRPHTRYKSARDDARLAALALVFLFCAGGCAWGYAGEEGVSGQEPQFEQDTRVVHVAESSDPATQGAEGASEAEATEAEEAAAEALPCGRPNFTIHFYDASTRVTKEIDCASRAVTNVTRTPMGDLGYQDARAANLPEGSWYLLVDPKGLRARYLNNDHLLKLSREFDIEYFGRDAQAELLIYLYEGQLP